MRTIKLQQGIIYGPVRSWRLGLSLGLNISPRNYKLCSFNCIYCQYSWTAVCTVDVSNRLSDLPTPDDFRKSLQNALHKYKEINYITFSGNGEPTLHPHFEELVDIAKQLKEQYAPNAKLALLSNSSTCNLEKVRRALTKLDVKIMKLDASNLKTFRQINRACKGVDYQTILNSLESSGDITLQTMFVDGSVQNIGDQEVREWIEKVDKIHPMKAQIYSLDRPPAKTSLQQVSAEKLREIATQAEDSTNVPVEVISRHSLYLKIITGNKRQLNTNSDP